MIANNTDQHPCRRGTSSQHGHWTLGGQHAPNTNTDVVSRRGALKSGLACLLGLAGLGVLASDAAAQTVGMVRRQERRAVRHDRREDRRMARQDRLSTGARQALFQVTLQDPFHAPLRTFRFNTSQPQPAICDSNPRRKRCSARPGVFLSLCLREPPRFGTASSAIAQQPLTINVSPSAPRAQGEPTTILSTFTDEEGSWDRVYARELWNTAPSSPSAAGCA